jgi:hypothetical protein
MTCYGFALGPCYGCGHPFTFNPRLVPSIPIKGVRMPICQTCIAVANPRREKNGLPPIVPLPGAYDVFEEGE